MLATGSDIPHTCEGFLTASSAGMMGETSPLNSSPFVPVLICYQYPLTHVFLATSFLVPATPLQRATSAKIVLIVFCLKGGGADLGS